MVSFLEPTISFGASVARKSKFPPVISAKRKNECVARIKGMAISESCKKPLLLLISKIGNQFDVALILDAFGTSLEQKMHQVTASSLCNVHW